MSARRICGERITKTGGDSESRRFFLREFGGEKAICYFRFRENGIFLSFACAGTAAYPKTEIVWNSRDIWLYLSHERIREIQTPYSASARCATRNFTTPQTSTRLARKTSAPPAWTERHQLQRALNCGGRQFFMICPVVIKYPNYAYSAKFWTMANC